MTKGNKQRLSEVEAKHVYVCMRRTEAAPVNLSLALYGITSLRCCPEHEVKIIFLCVGIVEYFHSVLFPLSMSL
jgi:hypothetical protein